MPDIREDLPDETVSAGDDLDFTAEELFNELSQYFYQKRQPGDITLEQIKERFGIGEDTARKKVAELVKQGVLERQRVYEPGRGHPVTIYRRRK